EASTRDTSTRRNPRSSYNLVKNPSSCSGGMVSFKMTDEAQQRSYRDTKLP
ncbi:uncharacterized protein METZ01_LOCUS436582, partial [marine metagenome]